MRIFAMGGAFALAWLAGACSTGRDSAAITEPTLPATACGIAPRGILSDVRWPALSADDRQFEFTTAELATPCADDVEILALRVSAGFCGTCRWLGGHTQDLVRDHVRLVDVLVANDDAVPATAADLEAWRSWVPGSPLLLADGTFALRQAVTGPFVLPLTVLVDARTMDVVDVVQGPDLDAIRVRVEQAFATLENRTSNAPPLPSLRDGLFARWEREMAKAMAVPGAPPPDPSNAYADNGYVALLGEALFSEKAFAKNDDVSCLTCHDPRKGRADGRPQALGAGAGDRNTPSIALAAHARSFGTGAPIRYGCKRSVRSSHRSR